MLPFFYIFLATSKLPKSTNEFGAHKSKVIICFVNFGSPVISLQIPILLQRLKNFWMVLNFLIIYFILQNQSQNMAKFQIHKAQSVLKAKKKQKNWCFLDLTIQTSLSCSWLKRNISRANLYSFFCLMTTTQPLLRL